MIRLSNIRKNHENSRLSRAKYRIYPQIRTSPLDLLGFTHILRREVLNLHEIRYFAPQIDNFPGVTVVNRFRHRLSADTKNHENSSCTGLESERFEQAFELSVDVLLLQRVVIGYYVEILPGYDVLFRVDYKDMNV